jgi:hypothetical protein
MSPKRLILSSDEYWKQWIGGLQESAVRALDTGRTFHAFRLEVGSSLLQQLSSDGSEESESS